MQEKLEKKDDRFVPQHIFDKCILSCHLIELKRKAFPSVNNFFFSIDTVHAIFPLKYLKTLKVSMGSCKSVTKVYMLVLLMGVIYF